MLRDPKRSFRTSPDDFYLSGHLIRDHGLRVGQKLKVKLRGPRDRDKYLSVIEVLEIEDVPVADYPSAEGFRQTNALVSGPPADPRGARPGFPQRPRDRPDRPAGPRPTRA